MDSRVGQVLGGRYRILRRFGEGGMGAVYEAMHDGIGRKVAVKCLHPQLAEDPEVLARFQREAQAATAIGNEHITEVLDMGKAPDGAPFLVLELLEGTDLAGLVRDKGPLGLTRASHIFAQLCEALGAAHAKGIVHRDLKPENVFLVSRHGDPDFVKVLDFGIAGFINSPAGQRLTRTGTMMGTPYFMSPEQALGRTDTDQRSDVWAIGVLLFHCLTGRFPFHARTLGELVLQICSGVAPPIRDIRPDLPERLDRIVQRCLEKAKEDRYSSCEEIARELRAIADGSEPWAPMPPSSTTRPLSLPKTAEASATPEAAREPEPVQAIPSVAASPRPVEPPTPASWAPGASLDSDPIPATRPPRQSRSPLLWLSLVVALLVAIAIGVFALYVAIRRAQRPRAQPRPAASAPSGPREVIPSVLVTTPSQAAAAAPAPPAAPAPVTGMAASADAAVAQPLPAASGLAAWQRGCAAGDGASCWRLGGTYQNGRGVGRDIVTAVAAYERGCQLGNMTACNDVGFLFQTGRHGAPQNLGRAVERYRRACDGGELLGCNNLASALFLGQGVRRDPREAARLYAQSCQRGSPAACTNIGLLTVRGDGVRRNPSMGVSLLERACTLGHVTGCREAADLHRRGRVVPRDPARAVQLDARAASLQSATPR